MCRFRFPPPPFCGQNPLPTPPPPVLLLGMPLTPPNADTDHEAAFEHINLAGAQAVFQIKLASPFHALQGISIALCSACTRCHQVAQMHVDQH